MDVTVTTCTGADLKRTLDDLARLRIEVFRDWPYLYDGDLDYERKYLSTFAASKDAVVVVARDSDTVVGASTASPLANHFQDFAEPFLQANLDLDEYFYFGESILLPRYRGQGIGVRFFELREAAAIQRGFRKTVFCGVVRNANHPQRPADYTPLDDFWVNRGYRRMEGVIAEFPWKEVGDDHETSHPMQFWMKQLSH